MIHNASIEKYRTPVGAVTCGSEMTIRLYDIGADIDKVEIIMYSEVFHREYEMKRKKDCMEEHLKITNEAGVVWYYFRIWEHGRCYFYGAKQASSQGEGMIYHDTPNSFQITVYEEDFDTPRWMSKGIMYQIFPDRFCQGNKKNIENGKAYHESMGRNVYIHDEWEERPIFGPLPGKEFYDPCDYFGGDIEGIISKLDDLKKLGVSCIYLNPIGEAASNHRYNTSDYKKVDPFLGNNDDFKRLCQLAKERRIHVILDGVYSHTGDDSVYFNKKGNYQEAGAYQGKKSKYYDWYEFNEDGTYKSWWGFETLPEVDELNEKFIDYIITGENSVIKYWLNLGASGFRLDVADELPDEFIFKLRQELKKKFKNYALIGEVWEDVTTKESYGVKRKYALGKGLDSAMNYPLKVHVTDYLLGNESAEDMRMFLLSQQCNYPKPLYYALMNLLSSHDIPRIRTTLATGMNENLPSREQQSELVITSKMDQKGKILSRLAMAIQFFVPGMPCIYYGDEYGMHGLMDPFNRGTFFENDKEVYQEVLKLTSMRNREKALQTGYVLYMAPNERTLGILRFISEKKDVFGEISENKAVLLLINPTDEEEEVSIDLKKIKEGVCENALKALDKNLRTSMVKTTIASMDYKIMEL